MRYGLEWRLAVCDGLVGAVVSGGWSVLMVAVVIWWFGWYVVSVLKDCQGGGIARCWYSHV